MSRAAQLFSQPRYRGQNVAEKDVQLCGFPCCGQAIFLWDAEKNMFLCDEHVAATSAEFFTAIK